MDQFKALVVDKIDEDTKVSIKNLTKDDLPEGDVLVKVHYSSVNYKDGLATHPKGNIVKKYPHIPGIDLAGVVAESDHPDWKEGDRVIVTSYELGVSHYGGFSEYARVKSDWIVPLPDGLSFKEAMVYGTAGFTAALSVYQLEQAGVTPEKGPVLVTGATGGVGSMAVAILAKKGYEVAASTGKESEYDYLKQLGATHTIGREEVAPEGFKPIGKQKWAGAVDPVGGETLAAVLSNTMYGGAVAVSGLTAGAKVPTTVFPFILRGVNLLGIDSVYCPMEKRKEIWKKAADEYKPSEHLESIQNEVTLDELPDVLSSILNGKVRGRTIVAF
ncbi:acryloyl-CoA reductase [Alkalihalobacillus hwajinpoensis]|uniref:NADPH:quinone oxidoreductase family protein n=1 Tax=Guptibacillus hwajinpoensis TaxID=208199 RepID=UPI0018837D74|nr:acryloyl-CoA reductase [Pseudalkalibacillus hwajinpoensis]MBF0709488.1 acryloyl-CoA reductase [Pseudalkalibacillus hwajinpoensis]